MKLKQLAFLWNIWPPFLGLGISIKRVSKDYKAVTVVLKKRFWNANYYGTQFGGGIFAMTDGVPVLLLVRNLPKGYRIWDKSAKIEYLRKGVTNLTADIQISDHELQFIQDETAKKSTIDWSKIINIHDDNGQIVARVERIISIKRK